MTVSDYHTTYAAWKDDPMDFWMKATKDIDWYVEPKVAFDASIKPYGRWFPDGVCNTCYNAVDRHVEKGRGDQLAIIYDSASTDTKLKITYLQLLEKVQALALTLEDLGVKKGDRVLLYMPMVPEALYAMLACARLGAIHSVVFGGFAAPELAARIEDAEPKLILSASCGIEGKRIVAYKPLLDLAIEISRHKPKNCIILQRPQLTASMHNDRELDWHTETSVRLEALHNGRSAECTPVAATDPLYILYTSGTTGKPKGIVRDNGGHMVALNWSMANIYGVKAGDVFWTASDVGWVVGHSYIAYAPLFAGCTTVLFEGKPIGTPDAGAFWRAIAEHDVKVMFTAPTAIRAIRKEDPEGKLAQNYDLSRLRALFLAGERADPETIKWSERVLKKPIIDHWWQTETGWPMAANPHGLGGLPIKHGSASVPMPGYDIRVLDDAALEKDRNQIGNIVIKLPFPPGTSVTLWNADDRFVEAYLRAYPGYYNSADAGFIDDDGYIWVMGRTDDIINVAGHRISTGSLEESIASHHTVAECAVVGCHDDIKGELPCALIVLKTGVAVQHTVIADEIISIIRNNIGAIATPKRVYVVERLPKTRSGKILRSTIKKILDGDEYSMPSTIEDPGVLSELHERFRAYN